MAIGTPGAILTLGLGGSPSLMVTLGYGVGAPAPDVVVGKVGGDDVPRYEIWERRKPRKQKDAELKSAIQEAMDKALGRVKPVAASAPIVVPQVVAPVVLRPYDDDEDEEILMLL